MYLRKQAVKPTGKLAFIENNKDGASVFVNPHKNEKNCSFA